MLASLIDTCKLNKIEPYGYLTDGITAIVNDHKRRIPNPQVSATLTDNKGARAVDKKVNPSIGETSACFAKNHAA